MGEAVVRVQHVETKAARVAGQRVAAYFVEFRASVCGYALTVVERPEIAEDLAQETFLRLYTHLAEGNEVANPRAWVFRVCHNLAINHLKRDPRDHAAGLGLGGWVPGSLSDGLAAIEPNPEVRLLRQERDKRLEDSVYRLTERQKQCLYLRVEGFRYREIAERLNITISSVVDILTRAVERLQKANHERS